MKGINVINKNWRLGHEEKYEEQMWKDFLSQNIKITHCLKLKNWTKNPKQNPCERRCSDEAKRSQV